MKKELELYIHIPFCVRKCLYCDFLSAPASEETMEQYLEALLREIREFPCAGEYEVSTVFFGGGTPSVFPAEWTGRIMRALRDKFQMKSEKCGCIRNYTGEEEKRRASHGEQAGGDFCEITIECNPGTADFEKLRAYRRMGINRLSLGLQSADDRELRCLGRIHTWTDFVDTYQAARRAGFDNINIDLMSALPGQTAESWERTLTKVLELEPEHISAYSLIVEEGTPFFERYSEDVRRRERGEECSMLPSEEEEREMYELTERRLEQAGMYRYEISNYAKPGYECRHNCGYWKRTEYVGFGLGASSLLQNVRIRNPENLVSYIRGDFSEREREELSVPDQMAEFMFLGLRLTEGIRESDFLSAFGTGLDQIYGEQIKKLISLELLCRRAGRVFLTERGRDLANPVMAEFLSVQTETV